RAARGEAVKRMFAAAMDALASDDLRQAHDGFASVLAKDPKDADAARMLVRTEQAITQRSARLVESATHAIAAGRLTEAVSDLTEAAALDPHAPGLVEADAAYARAKQVASLAPLHPATDHSTAAAHVAPAHAST